MQKNKFFKLLKSDLKTCGGITIKKSILIFFFNASFRLLLNYRLGYALKNYKIARILVRYLKYRQITRRNCDISYKAEIGEGVKFQHAIGIVIGAGVVIKNNVQIWQQVTLGSHGKKDIELSYPIICDGVKIYAGAKIIGNIQIGENSIIGANSVLTIDVPANSTAAGVPAKIISKL